MLCWYTGEPKKFGVQKLNTRLKFMYTFFSVGYSGGIENLEKIIISSNKIKSVYTGGVVNKIAGGRPQYRASLKEITKEAEFANNNGITFEIALNAPCGIEDKSNTDWWKDIIKYLRDLENCGVNGIVASHPFVMEEIKAQTNMKLIVSTICEITNPRSALYYEEMGADIIVPSMNINYNFEQLNCIKKALKRATLRVMVNDHCIGDCPWRRFHYNHYAHSTIRKKEHYTTLCSDLMKKNPFLLLTNSVVRPEDLLKYSEITSDFKIVGRTLSIERLLTIIEAYSKGHYDDNYLVLLDTDLSRSLYINNNYLAELFEHKKNCKNDCDKCGYCINLAKLHFKRIVPLPVNVAKN
jgi:collagenase-like PrtC family protease